MHQQNSNGMLSPYRVLDLTTEIGLMCGKLLADLGANVIKVERPGGDQSRNIGPFYHDQASPERSLFWFAFNTNKRGITLDIRTADGRDIFRRLVRSADLIIESFPPGYLDNLGLGYPVLEKINPGIILVSISPFGQTGPYKDYKAPDIVAWAMGGRMYPFGDADRPPVRTSHHSQAYLHAGVQAAAGALIALFHRDRTGEGQHVDVSVVKSVVATTYMLVPSWDMMKVNQQRGQGAELRPDINVQITRIWPCKDGLVFWRYWGGPQSKRFNPPLVRWMDSEGMASDFLKQFNWETFDLRTTTQEVVDLIEQPTAKFFLSHTKAELYKGGLQYRAIVYPVSTTEDLLRSVQLAAREFWIEIEHAELATTVVYPGAFAKASEASFVISQRAPLIGENNKDIYEDELGISKEALVTLKQAGVI